MTNSYYNTMFGEFLNPNANEQYHFMLELERRFFQHAGAHLPKAITLIDLCCGEGTNAPIVLATIQSAAALPPIHYQGVDVQDVSITAMARIIQTLIADGIVSKDSTAILADVFHDLDAVATQADVLRLSHGLYYMQTDVTGNDTHDDTHVADFIKRAMDRLSPTGFALMFHETCTSDLFSEQFNFKRDDGSIVPKMTDAAERIEAAARAHHYPIAHVTFAPKLYFPDLTADEFHQLHKARTQKQLDALNTQQQRWVNLLMFAIQPPKEEFDPFITSGKFSDYVALARTLMAKNPRSQHEPLFMLIRQSMQILSHSPKTHEALQAICNTLQADVDSGEIQRFVGEMMGKKLA